VSKSKELICSLRTKVHAERSQSARQKPRQNPCLPPVKSPAHYLLQAIPITLHLSVQAATQTTSLAGRELIIKHL